MEKIPIWSFSIKRDLLEAKQICQLLTKVSARPADHTEPTRRLTRQETEFNWTEKHEKSIWRSQASFVTTASLLSYHDPKAELEK